MFAITWFKFETINETSLFEPLLWRTAGHCDINHRTLIYR